MNRTTVTITDNSARIPLPTWFVQQLQVLRQNPPATGERLATAIRLSRLAVTKRSGGPFGALVVELGTGKIVGAGVNLVTAANASILHAEMVALLTAQAECETYDLSLVRGGSALYSSTAPCAMCLGALVWAGISEVHCAARTADAEAIGFDEGPKPVDWVKALEERGVEVHCDDRREDAVAVLQAYNRAGGPVYSPNRKKKS